jgi:ABC-2 type transport system permease protein
MPALWPLLAHQVGYQLRLLSRTPRAVFGSILMPAILLALRLGRLDHGDGAIATQVAPLIAGLTVLGLASTAYVTYASSLVAARQDGVLRRWRTTPLPAAGYFCGRMVATVLLAEGAAAALIAIGIAMTGMHLSAGAVPVLVAVVAVGALAFAAIATALTVVIPTVDAAFPVLAVTFYPLVLLSGAFGSLSTEPGWLTAVLSYLPAQPLVDAVTGALRHAGGVPPLPARDLLVLACWGAVGLTAAVRFFRWEPTRPPHAQTARPAGVSGPAAR